MPQDVADFRLAGRLGAPPVLLMHGTADDLVPAAQSVRLAEALRRAGAQVELELVPGASHFWKGVSDVAAIIARSIGFLRARASAEATAEPPEAVPG